MTPVPLASESAPTCNRNGNCAATPSKQWSKRRPDASLLPGLPIAHAEGRKKQEIKYTWPRSSPLSEPDPVLGPRSCSTSADFRRAVQRLISSSITALISVSLTGYTCAGNHWVIIAMPSRRWSTRRPDASLLPGLPIARAEGRKKPEIKYHWHRSFL